MKNWMIVALALALTGGYAAAEGKAETKAAAPAAAATTVSGELVDMGCYLSHGGDGAKHEKCAKMCVQKGGAPLGLVTKDGALYLVVGDHGDEKPYAAAKELAGENATVTGRLIKKGGVQAILVSKVSKQ